jgi:uncharacterized protein YprB with RNaseH-like and TPR domain
VDLSSRLRAIVKGGPPKPVRELTYEPDNGHRYEASMDLAGVGAILGGVPVRTAFGECLVIDRRYEADRYHGAIRIEDCELKGADGLGLLDPALGRHGLLDAAAPASPRTIFIDLETTGLSGGAGTVAFLVGCGYFDMGAFQVRQFLLTSYASERALLAAVADFFDGADLIVTYNGKTFDVPMMETRWTFHRMDMPLDGVPHFDMLHPARRLWKTRTPSHPGADDGGCRLSTLERTLFDVNRVGDVPGFEIPARFFRFLRSGDPRPLEPVLEHNRIDLVSLAAVTARAVRLAQAGHEACRDCAEALALGRIYERAEAFEGAHACYLRGAESTDPEIRGEALYRLALRLRRERKFAEAAARWREIMTLTEPRGIRRRASLAELRQCAVEALAIHHEHRDRDLMSARELALFALHEGDPRSAEAVRHRIARLDRKIAKKRDAQLFSS